jgi:DNA-binding NarL/FixJ family response regulator
MRLAGEIDGAQAGTTIWKTLDIPVVYLTAHADGQTLQEIMRAQPFGYVMKPFCASEVDAAIRLAPDRKWKNGRTDLTP